MNAIAIAIVVLLTISIYEFLTSSAASKYVAGLLRAEENCPDFGHCHMPGDFGCGHCNGFFVEHWRTTRKAKILKLIAARYVYYIDDDHFPAFDPEDLPKHPDCQCTEYEHEDDEEEI